MNNLFESGCSTALARKENPQTSKDAAKMMVKSGALSRQEDEVYQAIQGWHSGGFTTKDISLKMTKYTIDKAYDICRKRFSGLSNKFKITTTSERRDNCQVWRLL